MKDVRSRLVERDSGAFDRGKVQARLFDQEVDLKITERQKRLTLVSPSVFMFDSFA